MCSGFTCSKYESLIALFVCLASVRGVGEDAQDGEGQHRLQRAAGAHNYANHFDIHSIDELSDVCNQSIELFFTIFVTHANALPSQ
jgi:hypothetical protein